MSVDVERERESGAGAELVAGGGLGLLTGLLLGLSVASVVGSVVAALAAVLAGFFGLRSQAEPGGGGRVLRIGAFGVACSLGLLAGVAIRAQDLFAPSVAGEVERWTQAGYPPEQARQLVAFRLLGVAPKDAEILPKPARDSVLFAGPSPGECGNLAPQRFAAAGPEAWAEAMTRAGAGWRGLAEAAERVPAERRAGLLEAAWRLACE